MKTCDCQIFETCEVCRSVDESKAITYSMTTTQQLAKELARKLTLAIAKQAGVTSAQLGEDKVKKHLTEMDSIILSTIPLLELLELARAAEKATEDLQAFYELVPAIKRLRTKLPAI